MFGAECFAYCLMGNHFHLFVHTPRANLPQVMHHIDGLYARYVNWRHGFVGGLFDGPYIAIVIDDTCHLQNAIAYVLRNPIEAGLTSAPGQWPWSSYNATMGKAPPHFLTLTWVPAVFDAPTLQESRRLLDERILNEQKEYSDIVRAVAEGPHEFKKRVRTVIGETLYRARLPRSFRALGRPSPAASSAKRSSCGCPTLSETLTFSACPELSETLILAACPELSEIYSSRRATVGSTRAARRAGSQVAARIASASGAAIEANNHASTATP